MAKYMNRRDDVCAGCGIALPAGSQAYWMPNERLVKCQTCHDNAGAPNVFGAGCSPELSLFSRSRVVRRVRLVAAVPGARDAASSSGTVPSRDEMLQ